MVQFAKITISNKKLIGYLISGLLKGEEFTSLNLNPPRNLRDNSPNFTMDGVSLWVNESKFNDRY